MKKQNDILEIQNQEFIVSIEAKKILNDYIKSINKKYRLDKATKKELHTALRDILNELAAAKKKTTVSEKTAHEAVKMIGDNFEGRGNLSKLKTALIPAISLLIKRVKKVVLTESFRRRMYYGLALISLLPLAAQISALPALQPNFSYTPVDYTAYESTLGTVTLGDYANSAFHPTRPDVLINNTPAVTSIVVVFVIITLTLIGLAQKTKYLKFLFGALIVSVVVSFAANQNNEAAFQQMISFDTGFNTSSELISRESDDYDTLSACGSQINYIELDRSSAGAMYYALKDQGFTFAREFSGPYSDYTPKRDELCTAYDELRKKLPNESIILQSFTRDKDGRERPVDLEERYGSNSNNKYFKIYLGFFVKEN